MTLRRMKPVCSFGSRFNSQNEQRYLLFRFMIFDQSAIFHQKGRSKESSTRIT